jgi:hypothetical protein
MTQPFKVGDRVRRKETKRDRTSWSCGDQVKVVKTIEGNALVLEGDPRTWSADYFDLVEDTPAQRRTDLVALVAEKEALLIETRRSIEDAKELLAELEVPEAGEVWLYKVDKAKVRIRATVEDHVWLVWIGVNSGRRPGFTLPINLFKQYYTRVSQ